MLYIKFHKSKNKCIRILTQADVLICKKGMGSCNKGTDQPNSEHIFAACLLHHLIK